MAVRTSASCLPVGVPPAAHFRSLLRSSSQHSNSCVTTCVPVNLVPALYSFQRVTKYAHSSLVPTSDTDGRFTLSAFVFAGAVEVVVGSMNVKEGGRDDGLVMISFKRTVRERAPNLDHTVGVADGHCFNA